MKKSEELSMDTGAYLNSVFGLKGKVILITGAAGGMGNAGWRLPEVRWLCAAGIWKSAER